MDYNNTSIMIIELSDKIKRMVFFFHSSGITNFDIFQQNIIVI